MTNSPLFRPAPATQTRPRSLARRIVETVGNPYYIEGHRLEISTSIGITLAPRDGAQADLLMKNADLALYRSKASGRDGFAFYQARDERCGRRPPDP